MRIVDLLKSCATFYMLNQHGLLDPNLEWRLTAHTDTEIKMHDG